MTVRARLQTAQTSKGRELEHFDIFASTLSVFSGLPRLQPAPPEPDLVIDGIGVEVSELFPPGPRVRRLDAEQDSILEAARRMYATSGGPPVHVFVSWSVDQCFAPRNDVALALSKYVREHAPRDHSLHEFGDAISLIDPSLPITQLRIGLAISYSAAEWRDGDMHEVPVCSREFVQRRLLDEDPKIARYRVPYAAHWQVFVLGAAGPSTWSYVPAWIAARTFVSRFDRVFLLEFGRKACPELALESRR